ncbi:transporter, SSS family [Sphingomonas guangdongensis]|uniref:Transporter, SSS family n=1 Tax=Sphingomonas guangdongensis TaxID=1141890 RepID=A0A285Q9Q4_9SPHN|nr:sodium:solute symporter [Sphingomonas guangdongensis]SOB78561.1 transporter, SSS family [Sphingomonas guangdongensis]
MNPGFAALDWVVVGLYLALLVGGGWAFSRAGSRDAHDYFLAGRSVPAWLAAVSVLSATQSAATFLGGPDYSYRLDFTYLGGVASAIAAAVFVARVLIPRFYAVQATTVYELLARRYDARAMRWAGGMFLIGRVLAGGARVYLAAIAIAMVMFESVDASGIIVAAGFVMLAGFLFTFIGGLRAVLWNDLIQFVIYVGAAVAVLVYLRWQIPADNAALWRALTAPPTGPSKLRLFDLSADLTNSFSILAVCTGLFLLNVGNAGLDQDTTQRLLASPDAKTGARGLILSQVASVPLIALFMGIGALLYVFYQRPDVMGVANDARASFAGEKVSIFVHYILTEVPPGLRGLVTIGVTAAAVATTNSALNAMSSVLITDFYRPWRERHGAAPERHFVIAGRWGMAVVGVLMFAMAVLSFYWQRYTDMPLLEFALQVMVFAYAGLLGVYFVAVFTTRGTTASVIAGLLAGFGVVLALQPFTFGPVLAPGLAFPFQLCLGTLVAALVCAAPSGRVRTAASGC